MSKRLEQFVRDNREAFDSDCPQQGWEKLEAALEAKKRSANTITLPYLNWAAAVLLVLFAGILYWGLRQGPQADSPLAARTGEVLPGDVAGAMDPAYTQQVQQFAQLIKAKQKELQQVQKAHPQLYGTFMQESRRLDSVYRSLADELAVYPNQEELLSALIENLQWQLSLLNRQLQIVKQLKQMNYEMENI